jgi:phosphoglycerol transferase MdoB-like AlkP superfamily enzyme
MWISLFVIFVAETIYYSFYKTVFTYQALMFGGQVAEFYDSIFDHIIANWYVILLMLLPLIFTFVISKKFNFKRMDGNTFVALLMSSVIFAGSSLVYKSYQDTSIYKLLTNKNDVMETTNVVGLLSSINLDISKNLFGFEEKIELSIDNNITPGNDLDTSNGAYYNVMDIDFTKGNEDEAVKTLNTYFSNITPTNKNKMTGIFKGKNLIFITAEAFYPIAVDKDLTPTLYKLVNEGIKFNNYYQPIYGCSTSDGEFVNLLSILPGVSQCSMYSIYDTYLPFTIANAYKKYGYDSYAFHGWTYTYYHRQKSYPAIGFDKYYGFDRYNTGYKYALQGIKDQWPTSDVEVMNAAYPIFSESDKYVSYMMSISGHLRYDWNGNAISRKNRSLVENLNVSDSIKAYIAANIELDKSLEVLLNDLEKENKLDDTVIVIAPDHYPYGLTNDEIKSVTDFVENDNFDIYRNNLIIYNSNVKGVEVNKSMGSIDILPTLLNMFDVEYDSRLLIGHDIFSDASDLVIFNNKSWITNVGRYDYIKKEFYPFEGKSYDQAYIDKINKIVSTKFQVSKSIIQKNYYNIILGE